MLALSSCLFATIVLHAYMRRLAWLHHVFLALTVSSVLFHATHGSVVRVLDKGLAHLAFGLVLLDTGRVWREGNAWLLVFPATVLGLWALQCAWPERRRDLHFALHLVSLAGMHAFLGRVRHI
jgi:hypothetical protein